MGIETALVGSAIMSGVSSYRTQRANAKLAKSQLSASKEAQKEAEEAEAEALAEKKQALLRQRSQMDVALGGGYKTSTGAGIRGYI
ncbi:MAG: hypothetical protein GX638_14935 [Crenarchaeota archaeon]|nr:hypothetical protein [Thermoproteota archaeon]